jgi:hypothetical protein
MINLEKITLQAIEEDPEILDKLKTLAKTGQKLDAVLAAKKSAFLAANFHNRIDGERVLEEYKFSPSLDENLNFSLSDQHQLSIDPDYFLSQLEGDAARSHYLKPANKNENKNKPNPWLTGNRTAQLLMLRNDPNLAAQLQKSAESGVK